MGLSLTGLSVGVLEGYVIDQHKRKRVVRMSLSVSSYQRKPVAKKVCTSYVNIQITVQDLPH